MELRRQVSSELKLRKYVTNTALILAIVYVFGTLIFSTMGFLHYMEVKEKHSVISRELDRIEAANWQFRTSLANHKNDTYYLEKYARENFGMSKPDELIFLYKK
ncbi:MAG TPA: septum formation initiator family protein [Nitrospirae bacterium]|nr:septum formation initiator family protein [Nitrospirota bacterium]